MRLSLVLSAILCTLLAGPAAAQAVTRPDPPQPHAFTVTAFGGRQYSAHKGSSDFSGGVGLEYRLLSRWRISASYTHIFSAPADNKLSVGVACKLWGFGRRVESLR